MPPEPLELRAAQKRDWRALRELRLEALLDTPEAYGSTYEESLRRSRAQWKEMARSFNYFVALREGDFVGMASGGLHEKYPDTAWLYGMYVTPEERGTDVASALVDCVRRWARERGYDALFLHVGVGVPRARAFYRRVGFVETGERRAMTRDANLELVTMRLDLS